MRKTLLLNAGYEALSFISEKRVIKLLFKEKAEIVSCWDHDLPWGNNILKYPSILKLKNYIRRKNIEISFSRAAVMKRDNYCCQYCGKKLLSNQITIDHVVPKALGGKTGFTNCVVCCKPCNIKKAAKTLTQAGMTLLKKPIYPSFSPIFDFVDNRDHWHSDWNGFINGQY